MRGMRALDPMVRRHPERPVVTFFADLAHEFVQIVVAARHDDVIVLADVLDFALGGSFVSTDGSITIVLHANAKRPILMFVHFAHRLRIALESGARCGGRNSRILDG